jgi:glycosyltransferase involved in cell wall biosynthesis
MAIVTKDVTVIVPYYNNSNSIGRALYSICNQTYIPKFIHIVNDASIKAEAKKLNNVVKKVQQYCKNRIKINIYHLKKNSGPGTARNFAWNLAKTKYIAFLDADDSWHAKKIELQLQYMQKNKTVDICSHRSTIYFSATSGNWSKNYKDLKYTYIPWYLLIFHNFFTTPTVMLKTKIKYRFLDNKYFTEDYLLWLICSIKNLKISRLKITLTYLHKPSLGFSGLSGSIADMSKGENDTFRYLYENKYISFNIYLICRIVIFFKQIRRKIIL